MRFRYMWWIAAGLAVVGTLALIESPAITNPRVQRSHELESNVSVPPDIDSLLHRACFDCHSNRTRWPWYSHVPPTSWLVHSDVTKGRKALNFSEWSDTAGATPEKAASTLTAACIGLRTGLMPKRGYAILHQEARVSSADVSRFCAWADQESKLLRRNAGRLKP